jgi:tungstate transport system substrate-binding protein
MDAASDPMQLLRRSILLASLFVVAGVQFPSHAEDPPFITVATTHSALKSGLLDYLLPVFTHATGIEVYVAAEGTRHALESGELGECDVVLVHDRSLELQFMQNGFGSLRREVMYNDYIIVGPEDDPAKIKGMHDASAALRKIADAKALFISRGDMSRLMSPSAGYGPRPSVVSRRIAIPGISTPVRACNRRSPPRCR